MTAQELAEARRRCREDALYLAEKLGYDMVEDPHRELFDTLDTGKKKRLILWPRGHFKTSCVVVKVVQRVLRNPDIRVLLMEATLKLTKGLLAEVASHFNGKNEKSQLPRLFPEFCGERLGDALSFTVPARTRKHLKEATVTAASPKAITTGQHYTLMCFDDLVNANNFRNSDLLDKLESEFYHFLPLLDPGGEVIVTGTRYSHGDLYARILEKDKGVNEWEVTIRECWDKDGKLLFPERVTRDGRKIGFTAELLAQLQRDDPEMFAPQYLNKIMLGKNQLFPQELILSVVRGLKDPEFPAAAPCVLVVDLAESKKADSDHSVVAGGRLDGKRRLWVVEAVGGTYAPSELATVILATCLKLRTNRVMLEKSPGAEFFKEYLLTMAREKGISLVVDFLTAKRHVDAKYLRIAALSGEMRKRNLFLCAGITSFENVEKQFVQFPRGRHDDYPDAIALLHSFFMENAGPRPAPVLGGQNVHWVVNQVLRSFDVPERTTPNSRSLCGDGFIG